MKKIRKQSKFLMEIQLLVLYFGGIYNRYGFEIFSIKKKDHRLLELSEILIIFISIYCGLDLKYIIKLNINEKYNY